MGAGATGDPSPTLKRPHARRPVRRIHDAVHRVVGHLVRTVGELLRVERRPRSRRLSRARPRKAGSRQRFACVERRAVSVARHHVPFGPTLSTWRRCRCCASSSAAGVKHARSRCSRSCFHRGVMLVSLTLVQVAPASVVRQKPSPCVPEATSCCFRDPAPACRGIHRVPRAPPRAGSWTIHVVPPSLLSMHAGVHVPLGVGPTPAVVEADEHVLEVGGIGGDVVDVSGCRWWRSSARPRSLGLNEIVPPSVETQKPSELPRTPSPA